MNVLGISGSPHKNGNTAYAVQAALEVLAQDGITTRYKMINPPSWAPGAAVVGDLATIVALTTLL